MKAQIRQRNIGKYQGIYYPILGVVVNGMIHVGIRELYHIVIRPFSTFHIVVGISQ